MLAASQQPEHLAGTITYCGAYIHVNERCRRKEEASKFIQTTKQHNTAVTFQKKNEKISCFGWDSNP